MDSSNNGQDTGSPDPGEEQFLMPQEGLFKGEDGENVDFIPAPDLTKIALMLIDRHPRFAHLEGGVMDYLWKRKGGKTKGKPVLGATQKATGLVKYYSGAQFVIWLAADNCRDMTAKQVEATVFHQLCHIEWDPEDGRVFLVPHDFAGFVAEIEEYGDWKRDLVLAGRAFKQISLPYLAMREKKHPNDQRVENHQGPDLEVG